MSKAKSYDDLSMLALLGAICGLLSGLLMMFFYAAIYLPSRYFLSADVDGFENLPVEWRVGLSLSACVLLALLFMFIPSRYHKVGVPYVVERLNYHRGDLPVGNGVVQFFTAAIGLMGGLSIGKEGPAVHLGATLGGYIAGKAKLPQFGVETLLACGVAGAISAVFQTPLAGVLFAFEVIFLEYRQRYVLPVLLSSIVATLVSHYFLGPLDLFRIASISSVTLSIDLFIACSVLVVLITLLAALFFQAQKGLWRINDWPFWLRFLMVAVVSVFLAVFMPSVLGSGYGPLTNALSGDAFLYPLLLLVIIKTLLTAFTVGLGVPGGMIGPTFIIGGLAGAFVAYLFNSSTSEIVMFALLGMAAMMAASFQAPLTALVAIIEMTHSPAVIIPALFVIVLVCLVMRVVFHQESIFVERLNYIGMASTVSPLQRYLRQHTVKPVAQDILVLPVLSSLELVKDLASSMVDFAAFEKEGEWFLIRRMAILDALETVDVGPQAWMAVNSDKLHMDLSLAVNSVMVPLIEEPASLDEMMTWFQETSSQEALVSVAPSSLSLVSRQRLDQFLLEND